MAVIATALRGFAVLLVVTLLSSLQIAAASTGEGIWTKRKDGWTHHVQSDFACPPTLLGYVHQSSEAAVSVVTLKTVIVGSDRQPPGNQVGCEYETADGAWATVEIAKLEPGESVSNYAQTTRKRIHERYPDALRRTNPGDWSPKSPTGGETYGVGYYNIRVGERRGSVVVIGGDVDGWMITMIQFDYDLASIGLHAITGANWSAIANSRKQR